MNKLGRWTKTERQLLLYEILYLSHEVELPELVKRLEVSKKTIQRDIVDLTDAGLVKFKYSKKYKAYQKQEAIGVISIAKGTRRYMHLSRLKRLATFMEELSDFTEEYILEYNCKKRYFELFPEVSERTRMRDYKILSNIGYFIRWDEVERRHYVKGHLHQIREEF